ncbi:MAG: hypothetical protein GDA56_22180 [Hormoscilla sp. GM7CHS1pb]|nr:hypothetical protein [Hormoscilla sp. GM7CHS1pb]
MIDPIDDILAQARQGSVSAIIQLLNEKLASTGIRTRAIFARGVLQILCEAALAEQLEQSLVVDRIRQILESIKPRNIRRVNINSRLVQEQQLLWLKEISQNPDRLLWSQKITLAQPNIFQRVAAYRTKPRSKPAARVKPPSKLELQQRQSRAFKPGSSFIFLFLLIASLTLYYWLRLKFLDTTQTQTPTENRTAKTKAPAQDVPATPAPASPASVEPFVEAVRLAQKAAIDGKTANTSAEWLDLAAKWQRASDLMASVPPEHEKYAIAQDRTVRYRQNSQVALTQAERRRLLRIENRSIVN